MKKKLLVFTLVLTLLTSAVVLTAHATGFLDFFNPQSRDSVTISREEYDRLSRFKNMDTILQYVESWYIEEPDVDKLIENATRGLLYGLDDPYTFYYSEAEWSQMKEDDEGVYAGVGLQLLGNAQSGAVTITRVFRDTPAEKGGLHKGDILVRVEDIEVDFYSMQNAVNVMRGKVGEPVEIEVLRGEEYITFTIERDIIHVNRVEYTMLDDQVGYIVLYEFAGESQKEFKEALNALEEKGAKALIVDLRDNGGGWVQAAVEIGDLFLDDGLLIYSEDRYGEREETHMTEGSDKIPLVMMINENSASSSEILSGGLHDRDRAKLVGVHSYGKGIVQVVVPLNNDTDGFQMTYQQYFLPSGEKVHKVGIEPDYVVEMPEDLVNAVFELGDLNDPQLAKALEVAKDSIQ